jgi:hypothetical protein
MRRFSLLFVIYVIIGVVFAFTRRQITGQLLTDVVEAILVILLWPLTAFGLVNLNL